MGTRQHYYKSRQIDFAKWSKNLYLTPILFYLSIIALIVVISNVAFLINQLEQLQNEKGQINLTLSDSAILSSQGMEARALKLPKVEELPMVIEECTQIFSSEKVEILSFNLERFGSVSTEKSESLNYAVVQMKVLGSWEGINKGLSIIENFPDQIIKVDAALLEGDRGEFLFRIYYREPNNL